MEVKKMARSEAQKAADRRYKETHTDKTVPWGTRLLPDDVAKLKAAVKECGQGNAAFLRWAVEQWNEQQGGKR